MLTVKTNVFLVFFRKRNRFLFSFALFLLFSMITVIHLIAIRNQTKERYTYFFQQERDLVFQNITILSRFINLSGLNQNTTELFNLFIVNRKYLVSIGAWDASNKLILNNTATFSGIPVSEHKTPQSIALIDKGKFSSYRFGVFYLSKESSNNENLLILKKVEGMPKSIGYIGYLIDLPTFHNIVSIAADCDDELRFRKAELWKAFMHESAGQIQLDLDLKVFLKHHKDLIAIYVVIFLLMLVIFHLTALIFLRNMVEPLSFIFKIIESTSVGDFTVPLFSSFPSALKPYYTDIKQLLLNSRLKLDFLDRDKMSKALLSQAQQIEHDIRSPLLTLKMIAKTEKQLSDQAKERIELIAEQVGKITEKLREENLLKSENEISDTPVALLVERAIEAKKIEFGSHANIELHFAAAPECSSISSRINANGLARILSNILNNSRDSLKEKRGTIEVNVHLRGSLITIKISDNGVGIPEDIVSKVGTRGFSFGKDGGEGIGVFSAKEQILKWGGNFELSSQKDKGTVVLISLPVSSS